MRFIAYLIAWLLPTTLMAQTPDLGAIAPESRLAQYGKYVITRITPAEPYVITGDGAWAVYSDANADVSTVEPIGYVRPITAVSGDEEAQISNIDEVDYVYTQYVPGESSFFGGQTLEPRSKAMNSVPLGRQYALPVYDVQGDWLRLEPGWVHRSTAWEEATKLSDWKSIYSTGVDKIAYAHPKEKKFQDKVELTTLNTMRNQTKYDPIGNVTIYRSPSFDGVSVNDVASPLRFSMLEVEGDWIKVFVARPNCFGSNKSDYREGTVGWVSVFDKDGIPQLKRNETPCN